jgi:magnesium transporter
MISNLRRAVRLPQPRTRGVDLSHPARSPLGTAVVNCAVYADGVRQPGDHPADVAIRQVRECGNGFVWIGLHEPSEREFAGIVELFGLHPLAVEDAVHAHQRPKLEHYDDSLFTAFKTVRYVEHDRLTDLSEVVETGEIMLFTGADFVITVRHGGHGSLGPLREQLESVPEQLALGPSAVLHAVADLVVDDYLDVTAAVQDDIDDVESEVFSVRGSRGAGRIYQLKRELLALKRAVAPLVRPVQALAGEPMDHVDPRLTTYFRDVADHLDRVTEQITAFDELLNSILQAHLAQVTVAQNEGMRRISSWVAILAVPTMVCGIYGMNFRYMPEKDWPFGYPLVVAVTLAVCGLIHRGFKRNGWL